MAKHHKHKGAHRASSRKPPRPSAGPAMPGPHEFSAPQEAAMRAGMRGDRGAPPTDGSMPQPQMAGGGPSPGADGDFDDL